MPERLRVLQATPGYAPAYGLGGPTQSLEGLDKHLARLGVDVRVLTTDCAGKKERLRVGRGWQTWEGIPVRYVRRWLRPDVSPAYLPLAIVEARRADVLHVTGIFSVPSMQAMVAAIATRRPVVLSARGALELHALSYGPVRRKQSWLAVCKPLLNRVTTFHATSDKEADSIRGAIGGAVHVQVIPNGVDLPSSGRPAETEAGDPIIGFLGRIHRVKALSQLIDAAAILRARAPRFSLHLAGPTPDLQYHQELLAQVQRLGLQSIVFLPGELLGEAKRTFYERCRVIVLPSSTENFGNIVPEALSHGVPVVASRFTPWAELEDVRCGRWVENSPTELANAIETYLRSPDLARIEGERGRALVERRYTWEAVARSMIDVYREAISLLPSRRPGGASSAGRMAPIQIEYTRCAQDTRSVSPTRRQPVLPFYHELIVRDFSRESSSYLSTASATVRLSGWRPTGKDGRYASSQEQQEAFRCLPTPSWPRIRTRQHTSGERH